MHSDNPLPERIRLRRGVLLDFAPLDERELHRERMLAALPTHGLGTYFNQDSAAVLHGLPLWGADLKRVHTLWLFGGHGQKNDLAHGYRRPKVLPNVTVVDGQRTTTLARTAADLMRRYRFGPALAVADAALRLGADRAELIAEVSGGRGCRLATEAARRADPRSESAYESVCRGVMLQQGIPLPELQVKMSDAAGFIGRVDFWWRLFKVVGEFDGAVKLTEAMLRGRTPEAEFAARAARDKRLRGIGQTVLRWVADDIHAVGPFVSSIRAQIGEAVVDHGLCPEAMDYKRPPRRRAS